MAGILQFLEDAIQPAVTARAGYLQGQTAKAQAQAALARQSALDQINEAVKGAQVQADLARANRDDNYTPPPHTVNTDKGIMQFDPTTGTYKPTGLNGPEKAATGSPKTVVRQDGHIMQWDPTGQKWNDTGIIARASGADATGDGTDGGITPARARRISAAKSKLDEDLKFTPRPSTIKVLPQTLQMPDGKGGSKPFPNPDYDPTAGARRAQATADSLAYDTGTIQPDRRAYDAAVSGVLPTATVPTGGDGTTPPPGATGGAPTTDATGAPPTSPSPYHNVAVQANWAIQRIMDSNLSDDDKQQRIAAVKARASKMITDLLDGGGN